MKIKVKRIHFGETFTVGKLSIDGQDLNIFTIEDKFREVKGKPVSSWKVQDTTAIPTGVYKLIISMSNRFKKLMPEILKVEGFSGVRIHSGNTSANTEGCLILGKTWDGKSDFIGNSKQAVQEFMNKIQGQSDIEITIE